MAMSVSCYWTNRTAFKGSNRERMSAICLHNTFVSLMKSNYHKKTSREHTDQQHRLLRAVWDR